MTLNAGPPTQGPVARAHPDVTTRKTSGVPPLKPLQPRPPSALPAHGSWVHVHHPPRGASAGPPLCSTGDCCTGPPSSPPPPPSSPSSSSLLLLALHVSPVRRARTTKYQALYDSAHSASRPLLSDTRPPLPCMDPPLSTAWTASQDPAACASHPPLWRSLWATLYRTQAVGLGATRPPHTHHHRV